MDTQVSFEDTAKDLIYGDADNNQSVSSEEIAKTYSFDKQRVVNNVKWLLCELNVATASNANNEQNRKALMLAHIYGVKILSLLTQVQAKDNL